MDNPFGDEAKPQDGIRTYLILVSAAKDNMALAQTVVANIKKTVDKNAHPLWIDSKGIGLFVRTKLVAAEIRREALAVGLKAGVEDLRSFLIVEAGTDWAAPKDAATERWLSHHLGEPLPGADRKDKSR